MGLVWQNAVDVVRKTNRVITKCKENLLLIGVALSSNVKKVGAKKRPESLDVLSDFGDSLQAIDFQLSPD